MSDTIVTSDLTKFGYRELDMAGDLLKAYAKNGCDFLGYDTNVFMNSNSGNVFLADEDGGVGMMNGDKLEQWFSCPECGAEGFDNDEGHEFSKNEGFCSKECKAKN